jgi:HEAT repeat protein
MENGAMPQDDLVDGRVTGAKARRRSCATRTITSISTGLVISIYVSGCGGPKVGEAGPKGGPGKATQPAGAAAAPVRIDRVEASRIRERAIEIIEQADRSTDPQVRANAIEAALIAPQRLGGIIEKGLRDPNAGVRNVAAMAVGRGKLANLAEKCRPMLSDPTPQVRASAILALAANKRAVDRTPLATMLLTDPSPWVRRHAAFVLGEIGDRSAMALLRSAAHAGDEGLSQEQVASYQLQVAEALIKLGDDDAKQAVRAALYPARPEDLESAALAVQIISQVKDREATAQLVHLSEYKNPQGQMYPAEVRLGIAQALSGMGVRGGAYIADEFWQDPAPTLRAQAAFVYGYIGRDQLARLDTMMNDAEPTVRIAAAASVLRIDSKGR